MGGACIVMAVLEDTICCKVASMQLELVLG